MSRCYSAFQHGADIGLVGVGNTLEEAFANAGLLRSVARLETIFCIAG
jgi:SHS2 domain-containing protein